MPFEDTEIAKIKLPEADPRDLSALEHLTESFIAESKKQANGLGQILNVRIGLPSVQDEPLEATTQTGRNAQIIGQAAADLIPVVVTAATLRFGITRRLTHSSETVNPLLKASPLGVNLTESMGTGFATSFLATPSDATPSGDLGRFLLERTKYGITGAASFALLTHANMSAKAAAESIGSETMQKIVGNPIAHGFLSGIPTGFVNAEMESLSTDGRFTTNGSKIKQSMADMALVGGAFSITAAVAKKPFASLTRNDSSGDPFTAKNADQAPFTAETFQLEEPKSLANFATPEIIAHTKAQSEEAKSFPILSKPEQARGRAESFVTAARSEENQNGNPIPPQRIERAAWVDAPNIAELTLNEYRKFLRRPTSNNDLDALEPDTHWNLRADRLSDAIAARINALQPKESNFWKAIESYSETDQPIVRKLLEYSAGLSNDFALQKSLFSMKREIASKSNAYAAEPSASGNMLAYLYRKAAASGSLTRQLSDSGEMGHDSIIFAGVDSLTPLQLEKIKNALSRSNVSITDLHFDRLPNVVDFALGDSAVKMKLDKALADTRETLLAHPDITADEAIKATFDGTTDRIVASLNQGSRYQLQVVRPAPMSVAEAFTPRVEAEAVKNYLVKHFPDANQRVLAAEMLGEDVQFHTTHSMVERLQTLHDFVQQSARDQGIDPAKDVYLVGLEAGQASSEGYMAYLYARANSLPSAQMNTVVQYREDFIIAQAGRAVVVDDAFYTGKQITANMALVPGKKAIAAISAHSGFARRMHDGQLERTDLVTVQTDFDKIDYLKHREEADHTVLASIMGDAGYGDTGNLKVFPHMVSDNTARWLARFAYQNLKTPSPYYTSSPWEPKQSSSASPSVGTLSGLLQDYWALPDLHLHDHLENQSLFGDFHFSNFHGDWLKSSMEPNWSESFIPFWDTKPKSQTELMLEKSDQIKIKEIKLGTSKSALGTHLEPPQPTSDKVKDWVEQYASPHKTPPLNQVGQSPKFLTNQDKKTKHWLKPKDSAPGNVADDVLLAFMNKKHSTKPYPPFKFNAYGPADTAKVDALVSKLFEPHKSAPGKPPIWFVSDAAETLFGSGAVSLSLPATVDGTKQPSWKSQFMQASGDNETHVIKTAEFQADLSKLLAKKVAAFSVQY